MAPSTSKSINEGSQQYPYPSNVDVASYVKIKLDGQSNYVQWQKQMQSLIDKYNMRGFIDGTIKEPQMTYGSKTRAGALAFATTHGQWKKSDTLVRNWILGSLSKDVRRTVNGFKTANDIWNALKAEYNTITHENIKEVKDVRGTVDGLQTANDICNAQKTEYNTTHENSKEDVRGTVDGLQTANDICNAQKAEYNTITHENSKEGSIQYPYPTHVNAASFVSIKLSGMSNYRSWSKQMRSLVLSHDMIGFINGNIKRPQTNEVDVFLWERSDVLVQGWIYGSLSEDVMATIVDFNTAHDVWKRLMDAYTTTPPATPNNEFEKYIKLRKAIDTGDWEKAQVFFKDDKEALIDPIDQNGNTALQLASNQANIHFFVNLLNQIDFKEELTQSLANVLRYAIKIGNKAAVQKLVEKAPNLLFVEDDKYLPLMTAAYYSHRTIFDYLFSECKNNRNKDMVGYINLFDGQAAFTLLTFTISAGFFDVAYDLVKNHSPKLPDDINHPDIQEALCSLAQKCDAYRSGKQYNSCQRFVYSRVPIECCDTRNNLNIKNQETNKANLGTSKSSVDSDVPLENCSDTHNNLDIENQETNKANLGTSKSSVDSDVPLENFSDTHNNLDIENQETNKANLGTWKSSVDSVTESYPGIWKALRHVPYFKRLHEDKVKHHRVLSILKFICKEVSKLKDSGPEYYEKALILAVENNIPEVIEQVTQHSPLSIRNTRDNGYTLYQLSIKYRSENAYNYLVYDETCKEDLRHQDSFSCDDNLLHMAAKLAPQDKLNLVTGAALQMQRELQWFKEVDNLVSTEKWEAKNKEKKTFNNEHEDLRKKGEEWMKSTAESYTITATLIVTIVFAAAITVPGGTNGDTGKAIYNTKLSFKVFIVADAISLFTSTTSLLLFLSILTARYAEEDFLNKLPRSLILARLMLFVSMTTMLMAFSAALYIMSGQDNSWILIPIVVMTCLPIVSFVTLQLPLLVDLIYSTYGPGIFGKLSTLGITS